MKRKYPTPKSTLPPLSDSPDITTPAGLMQLAVDQLKSSDAYKQHVGVIVRDVVIMEWILKQKNAASKARTFLELRMSKTPPMDRAKVMRTLGWVVS